MMSRKSRVLPTSIVCLPDTTPAMIARAQSSAVIFPLPRLLVMSVSTIGGNASMTRTLGAVASHW